MKKLLIILTIPLTLALAFYLFGSPVKNNESATIQKFENHYIVTATGKRLLMAHDLISLLMRRTYMDTIKFIIPRTDGIINGQEIPTEVGYYKMLGTLTIQNEEMNVDLYYDNYDGKIQDPLSWNGVYKLQWITN
jgi:hypothetical protein